MPVALSIGQTGEPMTIQPPVLPLVRSKTSWRPLSIVVLGFAQVLSLLGLAAVMDGVRVRSLASGFGAVVVIALLGALVWPALIRLTMPLITLTLSLFTLVLNGAMIAAASWLVDGFDVSSLWSGLVVAFVLTAVNLFVGGLLNIDDDHVWRQKVVRRLVRRREAADPTDVPGVLFIQIDGLGHEVLREAFDSGHAPTLASFVAHGTHDLLEWECDLSSQTGAMQAGILLGDNTNMPAFRWYEKETKRIIVSNRPTDAADIEARQSTGTGLLVDGGASRANVFSGDAPDSMFTFSRITGGHGAGSGFVYVLSTPYSLVRIIVLFVSDIVRELRAARRSRRARVEPRMHRGGVYPLLRAATTVVLPEVTSSILIADIARGVPSAYADLVGYDEVAHHSGIASPEALDQLRRADEQIRRILTTLDGAPRPYHVVILSDHGQTQGSTFLQRYGHTLEDLITSLVEDIAVDAPALAEEGWNNINGLLSDAATDTSTMGRTVAFATRSNTVDGEVQLGPMTDAAVDDDATKIVVLASGNLGLLSFASIEGRASRQQIEGAHPGLLDGLAADDGIGFVMVRDEVSGDAVIGAAGTRYLRDDRVEGTDPLATFGPNAADHLRRTSSFTNCPDVLINSFFDPVTDEGAAFEELIGFHGGMGGKQTRPFVLAPAGLSRPDGALVGARSIHELFTSWMSEMRGTGHG